MGGELFYSKWMAFGNWESAPFRMLKGASRHLFIINAKLTSVVAPCGNICVRYHPRFENILGNLRQNLRHELIAFVKNSLSFYQTTISRIFILCFEINIAHHNGLSNMVVHRKKLFSQFFNFFHALLVYPECGFLHNIEL
jgi:hypothetical protein